MNNNLIKKASLLGGGIEVFQRALRAVNPADFSDTRNLITALRNNGVNDVSALFSQVATRSRDFSPDLLTRADEIFAKLKNIDPSTARSARTATSRAMRQFADELRQDFPAPPSALSQGVDAAGAALRRGGEAATEVARGTARAVGDAGGAAARGARQAGGKLYEVLKGVATVGYRGLLATPGFLWRNAFRIFKFASVSGLVYAAYRWYSNGGEPVNITRLKELLIATSNAAPKVKFVPGAVSKEKVDLLVESIQVSLSNVDSIGNADSSEQELADAIGSLIDVQNAIGEVLELHSRQIFGIELLDESQVQPAAEFLGLCADLLDEIGSVLGQLEDIASDLGIDIENPAGGEAGYSGQGDSRSQDPDGPGPLRAPWSDTIYLFDKPFDVSNISADFRDALFGMLDRVIGTPHGLAYLDPQGGQGIFGDNHLRAINYLYLRGIGSGRQVGEEADRQLGRKNRKSKMSRKDSSDYWRKVSKYRSSLGRWRKKIFKDMREYVDNLNAQREDSMEESEQSGYGYGSETDYGYEESSDYGYEGYNKDGVFEVKKSSSKIKTEQNFEKNKNFTQNFSKPANYKTSDVIHDIGSRFNMQKKADKFSKQYYRDAVADLEDQYAKSYYAGLKSMYDKKPKKTKADYGKLYELHDETGPELIGSAHPQVIDIADAMGNGGIVENQIEQQRANIGVAKSMPSGNFTGRHAWVIHNLVKLAESADERGDLESSDLIDAALEELKKL